nr:attachment glycoprotein [Avian metapneumovirus]
MSPPAVTVSDLPTSTNLSMSNPLVKKVITTLLGMLASTLFACNVKISINLHQEKTVLTQCRARWAGGTELLPNVVQNRTPIGGEVVRFRRSGIFDSLLPRGYTYCADISIRTSDIGSYISNLFQSVNCGTLNKSCSTSHPCIEETHTASGSSCLCVLSTDKNTCCRTTKLNISASGNYDVVKPITPGTRTAKNKASSAVNATDLQGTSAPFESSNGHPATPAAALDRAGPAAPGGASRGSAGTTPRHAAGGVGAATSTPTVSGRHVALLEGVRQQTAKPPPTEMLGKGLPQRTVQTAEGLSCTAKSRISCVTVLLKKGAIQHAASTAIQNCSLNHWMICDQSADIHTLSHRRSLLCTCKLGDRMYQHGCAMRS